MIPDEKARITCIARFFQRKKKRHPNKNVLMATLLVEWAKEPHKKLSAGEICLLIGIDDIRRSYEILKRLEELGLVEEIPAKGRSKKYIRVPFHIVKPQLLKKLYPDLEKGINALMEVDEFAENQLLSYEGAAESDLSSLHEVVALISSEIAKARKQVLIYIKSQELSSQLKYSLESARNKNIHVKIQKDVPEPKLKSLECALIVDKSLGIAIFLREDERYFISSIKGDHTESLIFGEFLNSITKAVFHGK